MLPLTLDLLVQLPGRKDLQVDKRLKWGILLRARPHVTYASVVFYCEGNP